MLERGRHRALMLAAQEAAEVDVTPLLASTSGLRSVPLHVPQRHCRSACRSSSQSARRATLLHERLHAVERRAVDDRQLGPADVDDLFGRASVRTTYGRPGDTPSAEDKLAHVHRFVRIPLIVIADHADAVPARPRRTTPSASRMARSRRVRVRDSEGRHRRTIAASGSSIVHDLLGVFGIARIRLPAMVVKLVARYRRRSTIARSSGEPAGASANARLDHLVGDSKIFRRRRGDARSDRRSDPVITSTNRRPRASSSSTSGQKSDIDRERRERSSTSTTSRPRAASRARVRELAGQRDRCACPRPPHR